MKKVQVALFAASLLVFAGTAAQAETTVEEHKPILAESSAEAPVTPAAQAQPVDAPVTTGVPPTPVDPVTPKPAADMEVAAPGEATAPAADAPSTEVPAAETPAATDHDLGAHEGEHADHPAESHEAGEKVVEAE